MTVITRLLFILHLLGTQLLQTFFATRTAIGLPLCQQLLSHFLIAREAFGLKKRTFIVYQAQPRHTFKNCCFSLQSGTFLISIFNAQNELSLMVPSI